MNIPDFHMNYKKLGVILENKVFKVLSYQKLVIMKKKLKLLLTFKIDFEKSNLGTFLMTCVKVSESQMKNSFIYN